MKHAREDYNRIQDPALHDSSLLSPGSTPIAEDEPVFLLRAQDWTAPQAVLAWARMQQEGSPAADLARQHAERMREWQMAHGCKMADLPAAPTT